MEIKSCQFCKKQFDIYESFWRDKTTCDACYEKYTENIEELRAERIKTLEQSSIEAKKELADEREILLKKQEALQNFKITTTNYYPNEEVEKVVGIVTAECVFGMNLFRDMFAGVRDLVGGRSSASQKVLRDLKNTCLTELKQEAYDLGAEGVIDVHLDYQEFSGQGKSMLFLVASGTAVKFKK
jgi:uncharacterized protein YbjQ (UPF0145 family)